MRMVVRAAAQYGTAEDCVELLTARYKAAFDEYESIVARNSDVYLNGGKPSDQSALDEEHAFEALDTARYALLVAAERAYPTIH